jgi:hypothetical protein
MVKRKHEEVKSESSKATMAVMTVGGLAVAGLVVWALTRTVQPAPEPVPASPVVSVPMGAEQAAPNPALPVPETTAAQTSTYQANPPSEDENESVPRIAPDELKAKLDAKQVTVIDVRADTAFLTAHIPGSLNVPMATIEAQLASLPKDKPIVTYCT